MHGSKLTVQAAFRTFQFVGLRFNHLYRKRTDFALCGGRRGLCPSTPQAFPGKRLERNPLPWGLFVRIFFFPFYVKRQLQRMQLPSYHLSLQSSPTALHNISVSTVVLKHEGENLTAPYGNVPAALCARPEQ